MNTVDTLLARQHRERQVLVDQILRAFIEYLTSHTHDLERIGQRVLMAKHCLEKVDDNLKLMRRLNITSSAVSQQVAAVGAVLHKLKSLNPESGASEKVGPCSK
jgi:hypothetical protein